MPDIAVGTIFQILTNASEEPVARQLLCTQRDETALGCACTLAVEIHWKQCILFIRHDRMRSHVAGMPGTRQISSIAEPPCRLH